MHVLSQPARQRQVPDPQSGPRSGRGLRDVRRGGQPRRQVDRCRPKPPPANPQLHGHRRAPSWAPSGATRPRATTGGAVPPVGRRAHHTTRRAGADIHGIVPATGAQDDPPAGTTGVTWRGQITAWCAACHTRYPAPGSASPTPGRSGLHVPSPDEPDRVHPVPRGARLERRDERGGLVHVRLPRGARWHAASGTLEPAPEDRQPRHLPGLPRPDGHGPVHRASGATLDGQRVRHPSAAAQPRAAARLFVRRARHGRPARGHHAGPAARALTDPRSVAQRGPRPASRPAALGRARPRPPRRADTDFGTIDPGRRRPGRLARGRPRTPYSSARTSSPTPTPDPCATPRPPGVDPTPGAEPHARRHGGPGTRRRPRPARLASRARPASARRSSTRRSRGEPDRPSPDRGRGRGTPATRPAASDDVASPPARVDAASARWIRSPACRSTPRRRPRGEQARTEDIEIADLRLPRARTRWPCGTGASATQA